jgi:hypothetical protein
MPTKLPSISLTLNMSSTLALILMNIACMDPIIHGSAVYQARAILDVDGGCSGNRSMSYTDTDGSQEQSENVINVKAVPNPNNGSFILETDEKLTLVQVYSLMGQLMYSQKTELQEITAPLKTGVYFVHILTEKGDSKVIKIEVH